MSAAPPHAHGATADRAQLCEKHAREVAKQEVWKETIRKEIANQVLKDKFNFNPKTVPDICDKPHRSQWTRKFGSVMQGDYSFGAAETLRQQKIDVHAQEIFEIVKQKEAAPREKSEWPMTSSQEIGWDLEPFLPPNHTLSRHLGRSEITRYVDAVIAQGKNPFANSRDAANKSTVAVALAPRAVPAK